jgi:hypothetical protein
MTPDQIQPKFEIKLKDVPDERILMTKVSPEMLKEAQKTWGGDLTKLPAVLKASNLWWIDAEMTNLIDTAAKSFPLHVLKNEDICDDDYGICFFEKPIYGMNVDHPEYPVPVHAMSWSLSFMRLNEISTDRQPCISIFTWMRVEDGDWLANAGHKWMPLGMAVWTLGHTQAQLFHQKNQAVIDSNAEDCSRLMTIWMLASQKGISQPVLQKIDRSASRRNQRENCNISPIKIINLRKPENHDSSDSDSQEMKWSHRWIVDGHWRQQPYGQGRSQTRPVWIAPYVKGPENKPLIMKESVKIMREPA